MVRKLEVDRGKLVLKEDEIEGFLERTVTPIGRSGKADIPRNSQKIHWSEGLRYNHKESRNCQ